MEAFRGDYDSVGGRVVDRQMEDYQAPRRAYVLSL
jgi:hypothetical protein